MGRGTSFKSGSLEREIAIRGMTQRAFAEAAGIDIETLSRAMKSKRLHTKTFGKILMALSQIPALDVPADLVVSA